MTSITGIGKLSQHASLLAATKAAFAPIRYTQGVQEERDRIAKIIAPAPAIDETRQHLSVTDTYEADDTFAHTEDMKIRGGRLDLTV